MMVFEESDDRFYIGWSSIKNAGRGVFAAKRILAGDKLLITGVLVDVNSEAQVTTAFLNRYKFAAHPEIIDGVVHQGRYSICPLGYAAIVNHTSNKKLQNVEIRYSEEDLSLQNKYADRAYYCFLRDVEKGEEILGRYGEVVVGFSDSTAYKKVKFYKPFLKKRTISNVE